MSTGTPDRRRVHRSCPSRHLGPDARGSFRDERLRAALHEPGWLAHLATTDGHPVGFALVRGAETPVRVMNSFFVVNAVGRRGLGAALAASVLRSSPGRWELRSRRRTVRQPRSGVVSRTGTWTVELRPVPGCPDVPPDAWVTLTT